VLQLGCLLVTRNIVRRTVTRGRFRLGAAAADSGDPMRRTHGSAAAGMARPGAGTGRRNAARTEVLADPRGVDRARAHGIGQLVQIDHPVGGPIPSTMMSAYSSVT